MQKTPTTPDFSDTERPKAMYEDVVFSYDKAAQKQNISIVIPTGTAIQNGRSSSLGDTFCRDGYHLDLKYGRYTAACAWFETFFGESPIGITYRPRRLPMNKRR